MTPTQKNWLTTTIATAVMAFLAYITTNAPAGDTWAQWRPVLLAACGVFVASVYHAYQIASGGGSSGGSGSGGGIRW
jgi:hypothetical protein